MSGRVRPGVLVVAIVTLAVLVAGVVTAVVRQSDGARRAMAAAAPSAPATTTVPKPQPSGVPTVAAAEGVADSYYRAVGAGNARTAYGLLCSQDRTGLAQYAAEVAKNDRTGTRVTSFRRTGAGAVHGQAAAVPAHIVLADGEATPIIVLLTAEGGSWRVCSSNLGGILPAPGTSRAQPSRSPAVRSTV